MNKFLFGLLGGIVLCTLFFMGRDLLTNTVNIPKNHVTVNFDIETETAVTYISVFSGNSEQTIQSNELTETMVIFPNIGEGLVVVNVKLADHEAVFKSKHYVEPGNAIRLKIKDNGIETLQHF